MVHFHHFAYAPNGFEMKIEMKMGYTSIPTAFVSTAGQFRLHYLLLSAIILSINSIEFFPLTPMTIRITAMPPFWNTGFAFFHFSGSYLDNCLRSSAMCGLPHQI